MFSSNGLTAPKNTEIRGECTSISLNDSRTNSIEIDGVRFQAIVAKPTWVFDKHAALMPEQDEFPIPTHSSEFPQNHATIVLHITNISKKPIYFNEFFAVRIVLMTPSGKPARLSGPDSSVSGADKGFLIMPGDSFNILNGLLIYRYKNSVSILIGTDQLTFFFDFPPEPGRYSLQLSYENTFSNNSEVAESGNAGLSISKSHLKKWEGKVDLPPIKFCFVESSSQKQGKF